ncbi:hypothetical protein ACIBF1_06920 [Spirillospora sp. NPDC050679]
MRAVRSFASEPAKDACGNSNPASGTNQSSACERSTGPPENFASAIDRATSSPGTPRPLKRPETVDLSSDVLIKTGLTTK